MQDASIIFQHFPDLTSQQRMQFEWMGSLYREWNERINVVSRKDVDNIYTNHVLHSLGIAKVIQFKPGAVVLDVGTGGGFPGIPLAVMFPETHFHLVDSIGKKIHVVRQVADALGLKNVKAEQVRAEYTKDRYDFVVSRAVTRMKEFYGWIQHKFRKESLHELDNGILYLKGGDLDEEMNELKRPWREYLLSAYFQEEFFETKKVVYVPH